MTRHFKNPLFIILIIFICLVGIITLITGMRTNSAYMFYTILLVVASGIVVGIAVTNYMVTPNKMEYVTTI